jgi:hypothetical protein
VLSVSWLEARPGYILPVNRLSEPNTLLHEVVCPLLSAAAWDPQVACAKVTGTVVRTMAAAEAAPHFGAELKVIHLDKVLSVRHCLTFRWARMPSSQSTIGYGPRCYFPACTMPTARYSKRDAVH